MYHLSVYGHECDEMQYYLATSPTNLAYQDCGHFDVAELIPLDCNAWVRGKELDCRSLGHGFESWPMSGMPAITH
jgi:hypothetical protein